MATETDKTKTGALGTLLAVGLFATLSIMLAVTALVRYSTRGVSDQRQDLAEKPYRELHEAQSGKLGAAPIWTDKGQGKVSMPIERAKAKVLAELARDPSSATPPAPVQPTTAADAAGADAGVTAGEGAPGTEKAPAPAAPAPTTTHAVLEKKPAPAAGTVAAARPAAPTTAAAAAPAVPPAPAPAPAAPAAPKPTDG